MRRQKEHPQAIGPLALEDRLLLSCCILHVTMRTAGDRNGNERAMAILAMLALAVAAKAEPAGVVSKTLASVP